MWHDDLKPLDFEDDLAPLPKRAWADSRCAEDGQLNELIGLMKEKDMEAI